MFMRVGEVAEALDVSTPYAYKLIRKLNEELKNQGVLPLQEELTANSFTRNSMGQRTQMKGRINDGSI